MSLGAANHTFTYTIGMAISGKYQIAAQATMSSYPAIVFTFGTTTPTSGIYDVMPLASSATQVSIYYNSSSSSSTNAHTGVTGGQVYLNVTGSTMVVTWCGIDLNNATAGDVPSTGKITKP
jgi:hypothetical protein